MDSTSYRNSRPPQRSSEPEPVAPPPARQEQPVQEERESVRSRPAASQRAKRSGGSDTGRFKRRSLMAIVAIIVILALFAIWYAMSRVSSIDGSKYQAVFFTNGQVYFGKLSQVSNDYMSLKNVYYLQNKADNNDASPQSVNKQNSSDMELIKLGNEIHGPEDEMIIAKEQILFFENLKPQGTVSNTINSYQKNKQ